MAELSKAVQQAKNRIETNYVYIGWQSAGGPNECKHGYAKGIPCPRCDEALVAAASSDMLSRLTPPAKEPRWCGGEFVAMADGTCASCAAPKDRHLTPHFEGAVEQDDSPEIKIIRESSSTTTFSGGVCEVTVRKPRIDWHNNAEPVKLNWSTTGAVSVESAAIFHSTFAAAMAYAKALPAPPKEKA